MAILRRPLFKQLIDNDVKYLNLITDEVNGLWKEHPDIGRHVVLHPQVHVAQFMLKKVRAAGGDVQNGRDATVHQ